MPRNAVAPLAVRESNSRRMIARWIGTPSCSAASEVYTISFCHSARPCLSVAGRATGRASVSPSRLHSCARSMVNSGSRRRVSSSGNAVGDLTAGADRDDHHRNARVAADESGSPALARRCRRHPGTLKRQRIRVDATPRTPRVSGPTVGAILSADVNGELRRIGWCERTAEVRTFQGHEAARHQRRHLVGQPCNLVGLIDRGDGDRRILRGSMSGRFAVRGAGRSGDPAQHDAGGDGVSA